MSDSRVPRHRARREVDHEVDHDGPRLQPLAAIVPEIGDSCSSAVFGALRAGGESAGGRAEGPSTGEDWVVEVRSRDRRAYSESLVVDVSHAGNGSRAGSHGRLFAKVVRESGDDREFREFGEGVWRERSGLLAAAQVAGPADLVTVPRLLGVDMPARMVLMEYVDGEALEARLAAARWLGTSRRRRHACASMLRMGRWLKRFQEASIDAMDGVDRVNWWIGRCERILGEVESRVEAWKMRVPRDWSRRVIERLDYLGWQLPAKPPLVASHGDFGPWNVLADGTRLSVVDFATFHADLPTMDVANMVTCLEALEGSVSYRRDWLVRFRRAFLRGYRGAQRMGDVRQDDARHAAALLVSAMGQFSLHCHRISRLHDAVFGMAGWRCARWLRRRRVERQLGLLLDAWM